MSVCASKMRSPTRTWLIVGVVGLVLFVLSLILAFVVFPNMLELKITQTVVLEDETETWYRWKTLPIPLILRLYVFNVTNPAEVMLGAKPILKEIGPYVYKQFRRKDNIKINLDDDEVSYEQYLNHQFDQEESGNFTENDNIVVINPALTGIMNLLENIPVMARLVEMLNELAPIMFPGSIGVFLKTTPGELFFKGVRIRCQDPRKNETTLNLLSSTTPRSIKKISLLAMCSSMKRINIPTITEREDKDISFSVFGHKNTTTEGVFTIRTGLKDPSRLGQITSWNGKHFVDAWGAPSCNAINGTTGDIYSPFVNRDTQLEVFSPDICRSMKLYYYGPSTYKGISSLQFRLDRAVFADPTLNGDNYCFCPQRAKKLTMENGCLKTGALDVSGCQGVPIIMTFPHFLLAHESFLNGVDGLKPDVDKHEMALDIEPYTGIPLRGGKKMQINVQMKKIQGVNFTDKLVDTLMPVLWMYEGVELNDELIDLLNNKLFRTIMILDAMAYTTLAVGLVLILVAAGMVWRHRRRPKLHSRVTIPSLIVRATS